MGIYEVIEFRGDDTTHSKFFDTIEAAELYLNKCLDRHSYNEDGSVFTYDLLIND